MTKTLLFAAAAVAALSACVPAEINQKPITYRPTKKLNEKGTHSFEARAFSVQPGKKEELRGVPCKMSAAGFSSSFTTPAVVITPDMGQRTPTGSIECVYEGQKKLEILEPRNMTTLEIDTSAQRATAGAGLLGLVVGGISASVQKSRRDPMLDVYGYSDVNVEFRQKKEE
jgi:hypothetical protein